ncbi:hypothetical protein [Vulcanisaeta sp. JCM 16159]|uniref:hypothetical protein n=1 Tax=Vulcanisaeta sp. JCM 16159 TaxID=1295371 RepID=UPI0006D2800D|nr:hypothetical protein [Vulcanisaeta sp. JCM 16159]
MSSITPSKWLAALGIVAVMVLVLFIMGFWYAVYTPGAAPSCSGSFTLMEILTLILSISGVYLLINYLSRGNVSDILLVIFVAALVIFAMSFYLLSVSPYGAMC